MKLRCIIVDDEYLARQRLITLLADFEDVYIVAECKNGKEAVDKIAIKEPDLIFLDVQMPDMDGFAVLKALPKTPYVIFTTAYDSYALKAFEINAVDYLLKPFDEDRLGIAMQRMLAVKKREYAFVFEGKIRNLLSFVQKEKIGYKLVFDIKKNGRIVTVLTEDIITIRAGGNYVELHTEKKRWLHRTTMSAIENQLDPSQFLRVHRAVILNKYYIQSCVYKNNSEYAIHLKTGEKVVSGRTYKDRITEFLDEDIS